MTRKYTLHKPHKDSIAWQARREKICQFYLNFLAKKGELPTLEEVGKKLGVSRSRAGQLLKRLAQDGYVLRLARGKRVYIPKGIIEGFSSYIKEKK